MREFQWKMEFDVGHEKLNEEHKELLGLMNKIHTESETNADKSVLLELMEEFQRKVSQHLKDEEAYLEAYLREKKLDCKDIDELNNRPVDQDILRQLNQYKEALSRWDGELSEEFFSFLEVWMVGHTLCLNKQNSVLKKSAKGYSLSNTLGP